YRLPLDDPGGLDLDAPRARARYGSLTIDRLTQGVDDATQELLADGNLGDLPGATDLVALADLRLLAHDRYADVVFLQVEDETVDVVRKLDQLTGSDAIEPVDAGDAVAARQDHARFANLELLLVVPDLIADDVADLRCSNLHRPSAPRGIAT